MYNLDKLIDYIDSKNVLYPHLLLKIIWKKGLEYPRDKAKINEIINTYKTVYTPIMVGESVTAIEYKDVGKAKREGLKHPERVWRHEFRTNDAVLYGLPDGSIMIVSINGKKLWGMR